MQVSERIAADVPEFGGVFIDRDLNSIVVYLTDMSVAATARQVVERELNSRRHEQRPVEFRQTAFSYRQLQSWHHLLAVVHSLPAVVVSDVAERYNRVRIGVSDLSVTNALRDIAAQHGVPLHAVMVVKSAVPRHAARLEDRIRPFRGGTQIQAFYREGGVDKRGGACTYGVNVEYMGTRHMVVNSHCTQTGVGGYIGADIYQNIAPTFTSQKATYIIGEEVQDPPFTGTLYGCPSPPDRCRYSDAALVEITSTYNWDRGVIANPHERAVYPDIVGSTYISDITPRITIDGILSELMVGDTVEKIGRSTGKTAGEVQMTCGTQSVIEDGVTYVYLCTGGAFAGMQEGDSGSPVIWKNSQGQAFLVGLAFAGVAQGDQLFFNNWQWIDYELGSITKDLDPHWYDDAPPPPCEPPDPC